MKVRGAFSDFDGTVIYNDERPEESSVDVTNRKDFGLHWNAVLETGGFLVGDEVRIGLSVPALAGS